MPRCWLREVQYLKIVFFFFIIWKYFGKWFEAKCLICNDFSYEPVIILFVFLINWNQISHRKLLSIDNYFTIKYFIYIYNHMINRVGKLCVPAMSLCMIVLIVTRKRGDDRYYFALWQTNNNTPNKLLLSESAESSLLRLRSVSFTSRAKGCIKIFHHSCLVSILIIIGYYTLLYSYNFNPVKTNMVLIIFRN